MTFSRAVDGFRLAYDVVGAGPAVLLLHGWPGTRRDYRRVVPLLSNRFRVITPDLRGFGGSDKHPGPPAECYSAAAQVRSVVGLLDELGVEKAFFGGYDVGSRVSQAAADQVPDRIAGLVMTPPQPGAGERLLDPAAQNQFWYQALHRLELADALLDGQPAALRTYLAHFWSHWSGPDFALSENDLDLLLRSYSEPGAFIASIGWYRARPLPTAAAFDRPPAASDRIDIPTEILWPAADPLFPVDWSDRLGEWYADVRLTTVPGAGHFLPLEAPGGFAQALVRLADRVGADR